MKYFSILLLLLICSALSAQQYTVNTEEFDAKSKVRFNQDGPLFSVRWPAGTDDFAGITIDLSPEAPLLSNISIGTSGHYKTIASGLTPEMLITVGKRDLISQNGWNIFFDKTAFLPHETYRAVLQKKGARIITSGSRTIIAVPGITAGPFTGEYQFTLYNGSPLINIAAVMSSDIDSLAVIYDGGLAGSDDHWKRIFWSDTENYIRDAAATPADSARSLAVKYRTLIAEAGEGSLAIFPAPHQFFDPLDNCYNLQYVWYGKNYRKLIPGYAIGVRHEPDGDRRWVPWFNAPPGTKQRFNFFCLLSGETGGKALSEVKAFTRNDTYKPLNGYYTMASHFHQEHTDDVLTKKPLPAEPGFVKAFRNTGVNIVHLGEFHGPGSPRGPEVKRWKELSVLFAECRRLSGGNFLLLPGEEPNNFFGGHWMNLFPKPVYWVMSRRPDQPFIEEQPGLGKIYRVGNKNEMLKLLELENGLAWTAHARTKGSTGYPDAYKNEAFYKSDRFLGAAWKAMPADLSQPKLGKRILDLMDDMANWGQRKFVIGESDLFKIEPDYELYGHLNVNYVQLERLPRFEEGWQPVLTALEQGKFFVTTGEVLLPAFTVNGRSSGDTATVDAKGEVTIQLHCQWTFPLNYAAIISGDGNTVFRETISLNDTQAFGDKTFRFTAKMKNRKWLRIEVWDAAANGAFTQTVWLQ